ncbi:MAG TPA: hypothetical protein VHZ56_11310 [Devosia sp.]|jgi:hypothetical protein|nr:hypothetical protein [Devosia sp.]
MPLLHTVKTGCYALIVALAVGGLALPTLAAPPGPLGPPGSQHNQMHPNPPPMQPSFNFNFGFDVPGFRFGIGNKACLTDGQIVRELRAKGYSNVQIVSHHNRHNGNNNWVKVSARRGGHTYTFYIDSCRGNVGFW